MWLNKADPRGQPTRSIVSSSWSGMEAAALHVFTSSTIECHRQRVSSIKMPPFRFNGPSLLADWQAVVLLKTRHSHEHSRFQMIFCIELENYTRIFRRMIKVNKVGQSVIIHWYFRLSWIWMTIWMSLVKSDLNPEIADRVPVCKGHATALDNTFFCNQKWKRASD